MPLVVVLDRGQIPLIWPLGAFGLISLVLLLIYLQPRSWTLAMSIAGLASAAPAYFFGPNAWPCAVFLVALVLFGLREAEEARGSPLPRDWLIYASFAGSQALLVALILAGVLPDRSLTVVVIPGIPAWHHAAAHLLIQGAYLGCYRVGVHLGREYARLADKVAALERETAARDRLLQEARADYRRALALGRAGLFSGRKIGDFQLGDMLGRGGMGEVYEAVDESGTRIAVKLLRVDRLGDLEAQQRFEQERDFAANITGPNLPIVHATGALAGGFPISPWSVCPGSPWPSFFESRAPCRPVSSSIWLARLHQLSSPSMRRASVTST